MVAAGVFGLTTVDEESLSLPLPLSLSLSDSESDEKMGCATALIFFAGVTRGFFDAAAGTAAAGTAAGAAAAVVADCSTEASAAEAVAVVPGFVAATRARVTRVVTFAAEDDDAGDVAAAAAGCSVVSCESPPSGAVEGTS